VSEPQLQPPEDLASVSLSLREICEQGGFHAEYVIEMVEYGVLHPRRGRGAGPGAGPDGAPGAGAVASGAGAGGPRDWRFGEADLARLRRAERLRRDLHLDLAGLALALELLEENEALRLRVRALERQLDQLHVTRDWIACREG